MRGTLIVLIILPLLLGGCKLGTLGGSMGEVDEPSDLAVGSISSSQLIISWTDNSESEDGFTVERAPDQSGSAGTWSAIAQLGENIENYTDTSLDEATTYWYRVFTRSTEQGDSKKIGPLSGTTRLAEPLTPSLTAPSSSTVDFSWTDNSAKEDGFKIERADDNSGSPDTWIEIDSVGQNVEIYNDSGLTSGTKYWYRVYAYSSQYEDSNYTSQVAVTTP